MSIAVGTNPALYPSYLDLGPADPDERLIQKISEEQEGRKRDAEESKKIRLLRRPSLENIKNIEKIEKFRAAISAHSGENLGENVAQQSSTPSREAEVVEVVEINFETDEAPPDIVKNRKRKEQLEIIDIDAIPDCEVAKESDSLVNTANKKKRWTVEEDQILIETYIELGYFESNQTKNWGILSQHLLEKGVQRSHEQCAGRMWEYWLPRISDLGLKLCQSSEEVKILEKETWNGKTKERGIWIKAKNSDGESRQVSTFLCKSR